MIRLTNIKEGQADVLCDGKLIGWVIRTEWDDVDDDGFSTGYVRYLWEAVHGDERGGEAFDVLTHRREAVRSVVERYRRIVEAGEG